MLAKIEASRSFLEQIEKLRKVVNEIKTSADARRRLEIIKKFCFVEKQLSLT